ncbi:hypothetical protein [Ruegeria sp. EL01]|jgi:hypothetical protein|uniref:hypothetical protein n=1 Tax=Ruegeria sp. EL01 TaxID=2107578 RepID=UPI000EA80629|nr:hypothetical protein [Ruegeria sp. EL01]
MIHHRRSLETEAARAVLEQFQQIDEVAWLMTSVAALTRHRGEPDCGGIDRVIAWWLDSNLLMIDVTVRKLSHQILQTNKLRKNLQV